MKRQKTTKRIIASVLIAVFLLTIPMPVTVFAETEEVETAPMEAAPADAVQEENASPSEEEVPSEDAPGPAESAPAGSESASEGTATAQAEDAPAMTEAVPMESEPAPAESAPAPAENAPAPAEAAPVESESEPEESAPAPAEDAPVPAEAAPVESESAPEESAPALAEDAPVPAEAAPVESESAREESAPAPAEDTPAPVEAAPVESGSAPEESATVPAEDTPVPAEAAPVENESAPEESTPAPAEDAPVPVEAAPVENESAPEESAPAPAEDAPVLTEAAPVESDLIPEESAPAPAEDSPVPAEAAPVESESEPEESTPAPAEDAPVPAEAAPVESEASPEESIPAPVEAAPAEAAPAKSAPESTNPAAAGSAPAAEAAKNAENRTEIQIGDYVFTASGSFPEGTEIQAVEIPRDAAALMAGKAPLFAYDIRLVVDGQVWQPEDYGTDVQVSVRSLNGDLNDVDVDLLHVRTNLLDDAGTLSEQALKDTLQNMKDGSTESETIETNAGESGFSFGTSSFSPYVGTTNSRIVYVYNATLFNDDSANYAGVYTTKLKPNTATAEEAKTSQTIGIESIADGNLENSPTTESPAIIQGAAIGYENRISPTEYTLIDPDRPRPEPYSEFTVKVMEEQGADGTVHKKPSGFDGTYVIVRLDVSEFLSSGSDNLFLHMEQKDNKALMPAATVAKGTPNAKPEDYTPVNAFTDGLGNRSASYKLSDLVDANGSVPYIDVIVFATAANVAGADTASTVQGDIPLAFYVDETKQYNDALTEYDPSTLDPNDPNAATAYDQSWHAKFFDAAKAAVGTATAISRYLVKGSDLALETMVENSGGENNSETTYWSLKKSMENAYYDQEIDKDPSDSGSGITAKLMSEVAVTNGLILEGSSADSLRKRTLDVNSYDIQVANNSGVEGGSAESISLKNAWLTIADYSNTTGAEMAIGNNAVFVINQGGKLIIDQTCQLEIEWDGATTTPGTDQQGTQPDILNNGQLDLRAGGEIVNNGIITIEGTEGKPLQPETSQQANESQKGKGEMAIREGATLTNNGALVVYGSLTNYGTLINNGRYNDVIKSNDPDKGAFDYHKGIQVAWKDDVTQKNIEAGSLTNEAGATLINSGDIVLTPGTLENKGLLENKKGAHIYSATATEAIIPITPDPATPTVVTKRVKLDPVKLSNIINSGTLVNNGSIAPATVALLDNTGGFDKLTTPGDNPELFSVTNSGTIQNNGYIYGCASEEIDNTDVIPGGVRLIAALVGRFRTENDLWLYLYEDETFRMILPNGEKLHGTYEFKDEQLVFTFADRDRTVAEPELDEEGNSVYSITTESGFSIEFVLTSDFIEEVRTALEELKA